MPPITVNGNGVADNNAVSSSHPRIRRRVFKIWMNPTTSAQLLKQNGDRRRLRLICGDIDRRGFGWQVFFVASAGFFTESYNLFATNVILPCLAYIYWPTETTSIYETKINLVTLTGSIVGQLVFGYLADKYGRRKLYGVELVFVIFGTLGLVQCGTGFGNSMSIVGWLVFWRFFIGVGIGGEYPLSAVITSEFAPAQQRARMMAAVFLMQPLGQVAAASVGLVTLVTMGKHRGLNNLTESPVDHYEAAAIVDRIWRIVVGVGAVPAFLAIILRLTIPESARWTVEVGNNGKQALEDNQQFLGAPVVQHEITLADDEDDEEAFVLEERVNTQHEGLQDGGFLNGGIQIAQAPMPNGNYNSGHEIQHQNAALPPPALQNPAPEVQQSIHLQRGPLQQFSAADLHDYFVAQGNWRYLAGASLCWFLLDFAFFGLGMGNPRVIAHIWSSHESVNNSTGVPSWGDPNQPDLSIYNILYTDAWHSIITVSIGSLLGSIILIKAIDYVPRTHLLAWSFAALALLFATIGGSFFRAFHTDLYALTISLYVLAQLLFNLGPNTLTFIIPAEIFPTRYRATCHGIAAASGKLGSVIVQSFLPYLPGSDDPNSRKLGWVLVAFAFFMALGALFAWAWIPDVQYPRSIERSNDPEDPRNVEMESGEQDLNLREKSHKIPSKTLETLAKGRERESEMERVGFGNRFRRLWKSRDH